MKYIILRWGCEIAAVGLRDCTINCNVTSLSEILVILLHHVFMYIYLQLRNDKQVKQFCEIVTCSNSFYTSHPHKNGHHTFSYTTPQFFYKNNILSSTGNVANTQILHHIFYPIKKVV